MNIIIADFDFLFVVFDEADYFVCVHSIIVKLSHIGFAAMILCLLKSLNHLSNHLSISVEPSNWLQTDSVAPISLAIGGQSWRFDYLLGP